MLEDKDKNQNQVVSNAVQEQIHESPHPENINSREVQLHFTTRSENLLSSEDNDTHSSQDQFVYEPISYWQTNKGLIRVIVGILLLVTVSILVQKLNESNVFGLKNKKQVYMEEQNLPMMKKLKAKKITELLNLKKLQAFVKDSQYYDVEYFLGGTKSGNSYEIIQKAQAPLSSDGFDSRQELQFSMNFQQIELLINKMMHPDYRQKNAPVSLFYQSATPDQISLAYYYNQLRKFPSKIPYLEAQYYRLDKLYNIGLYKKQLPICIVFAGRQNRQYIKDTYQSIIRQNYTNYRVIHIDDNSNDLSIQRAQQILNQNSKYVNKFTLVRQKRQRNALFNINFAIQNYCRDDDIIVEMKPSAQFVGRQALQLINSLYQGGVLHKGSKNSLWSTAMKSLTLPDSCCPQFKPAHNIPFEYIQQGNFRQKYEDRIYGARTYLKQIYKKIDHTEFIDKSALIPKQYYSDAGELFIFVPLIQMCGVEHMRRLDESIIHEKNFFEKKKSVQIKYSIKISKSLKKYEKIKNLMDIPQRNQIKLQQKDRKQLQKVVNQLQLKRKNLQNNFIDVANNKQIKSTKKSKQQYVKEIQQRKVFNPHLEGKQFGYDKKFFVDVKQLNEKAQFTAKYEQYGIKDALQVGSIYDYLNLSKIINFTQVKQKLIQTVSHQVLTFKYDENLQRKNEKLKFTHFKSQAQMKSFLRSIDVLYLDKKSINDTEYLISQLLARSPDDQSAKQLQYYHLNKKYNIGSIKDQIPICVFSSGYKLFTNDRYKTYFDSYQRLNYTNFKIIWVDDYSEDNSAYQIYNYLKNSNMRIKNKIKIIYNLQHLGILANMHIYIQKYCGPDDVVIICDADDGIAGIQTFHILNSIYQDPKSCYVYSRFLMNDDNFQKNVYFIGPSSKKLDVPVDKYRITPEYWVTSHLRTFRKKVMDAVPLEHFVQYHQDLEKGIAWPHYYGSSADRFQIYSHVQICGNGGVKFINDFMLNYQIRPQSQCYHFHQMFDEYKSRIKTPLKPLTNLDQVPVYMENYEPPKHIFQRLKKQYPAHKRCKQTTQIKKKK